MVCTKYLLITVTITDCMIDYGLLVYRNCLYELALHFRSRIICRVAIPCSNYMLKINENIFILTVLIAIHMYVSSIHYDYINTYNCMFCCHNIPHVSQVFNSKTLNVNYFYYFMFNVYLYVLLNIIRTGIYTNILFQMVSYITIVTLLRIYYNQSRFKQTLMYVKRSTLYMNTVNQYTGKLIIVTFQSTCAKVISKINIYVGAISINLFIIIVLYIINYYSSFQKLYYYIAVCYYTSSSPSAWTTGCHPSHRVVLSIPRYTVCIISRSQRHPHSQYMCTTCTYYINNHSLIGISHTFFFSLNSFGYSIIINYYISQ